MGLRGQLLTILFATVLPLPLLALLFDIGSMQGLLLTTGAMGLCGVVAAIFISNKISSRLKRLERQIRKFGEGDFSVRVRASKRSPDGIPALESAFNTAVQRVAERRDRFVELDTLKSDFVSSVSHELRTPLTTIKALTRLLLRDDLPMLKRREYLETITLECDRQIDLVLNLLDLSRIEGGVFRLALDKVDVPEVVRTCVKAETRAAERRGHKLEIGTIADDIPPVCADQKALRRVLSNLIENSIKYTPDGGSISLFAGHDEDMVSIGVEDNGRGIPPQDLPVLFDKFHRGGPADHSGVMHGATDDEQFLEDADVSGLGLGLYLSKNVMERMKGSITVETEVGRGSKFTLHLPVWKDGLCNQQAIEGRN